MRTRALLVTPLLAAAAMLGSGASGASAVTLFTTNAHTTRVATGTTGLAVAGAFIYFTSGTMFMSTCHSSTLHFEVTANNGADLTLTVTSQTFSACIFQPATGTPGWQVTVKGTGKAVGATTAWDATAPGFGFDLAGGHYSGTLTAGVTLAQPTAGTSPLSLAMRGATSFTGPMTTDGRMDITYRFTGHAADWSLT
jgi:hypothetical protein